MREENISRALAGERDVRFVNYTRPPDAGNKTEIFNLARRNQFLRYMDGRIITRVEMSGAHMCDRVSRAGLSFVEIRDARVDLSLLQHTGASNGKRLRAIGRCPSTTTRSQSI